METKNETDAERTVLRITTFGPFSVVCLQSQSGDTGLLNAVPVSSAKAQGRGTASALTLLKILLCQPHRFASRDLLMEMIWPDSPRSKAQARLDDISSVLRSLLRSTSASGENFLRAVHSSKDSGNGYQLAQYPPIWVDADAFLWNVEQAVRMERFGDDPLPYWERAYALASRGPFLADEPYSEWASERRELLAGHYRQCVLRLAALYCQAGGTHEAIVRLRTFVLAHPTDDDVLYPLMDQLGQIACYQEALEHYQRASALLEQEGQAPIERTQELAAYLQLKQRQVPPKRVGAVVSADAGLPTEATKVPAERNEAHMGDRQVSSPYSPFDLAKVAKLLGASLSTQTTQQQDILSQLSYAVTHGIQEVIHELERILLLNTSDAIPRRTAIARLLGILPASSALDEHFKNRLTEVMLSLEKDSLDLYEDILIMGWDGFRRSKSPEIISRIDGYVNKLATLSREIPEGKREHWQSLLCRFSQLSTRIAQHSMNEPRALSMARQAIEVAIQLDDVELIASAFYRRGRAHMEYSNTATDEGQKQRHFALARADVDAALAYTEQVRTPLKGNIYLIAAEVYALLAGDDASLRTQCEVWQDKVATLVYGGNIEDDGTFLKLNLTALHHEKAKTLIQFGRLQDARRELNTAWETLQPNLLTWQMNMHLTETSLSIAERDLEISAKSGIKAYTMAKAIHSHKGEAEVKHLFGELQRLDPTNSYVRDLGMALGDVS